MKKLSFISVVVLALLGTSFSLYAADLEVLDPWVPEAPPNARVLGGYMKIVNNAAQEDGLLSASSAEFNMIELHKTEMADGVGKMIPQESIKIPANGSVELKPGSYHLMLMGAKKSFVAGDKISLELTFKSGKVAVVMPVKKVDDMTGGHHHHHH